MLSVDFSRYPYVPSILADPVGALAYDKLDPVTKKGVLPLFELCWHPRAHNFDTSLDLVRSLGGDLPFLLDIDRRLAPEPYESRRPRNPVADRKRFETEVAAKTAFDSELRRLQRPEAGFFHWREMISHFPSAVPVVQVTNAKAQKAEVLRQVQLLRAGGASLAFRITPSSSEEICHLATEILLGMDPRQILIVIDCGQGRSRLAARAGFVARTLGIIEHQVGRERAARLRAVCMSNSFVLPDHKGLCFRQNYDWEIWRRVSTRVSLAFGDYAGSQRSAHTSYRPSGWIPTVTHALEGGWLINRYENKNDESGWVEGCKVVRDDSRFSPTASWCDRLIHTAAETGTCELVRQRPWHAARMNGHMERQYGRATRVIRRTA